MPWNINDFSGGVIEKVVDSMLPNSAARESVNFIATKYGSIKKRKGQTKYNEAALPPKLQAIYPYYLRKTRYDYDPDSQTVQHEIEPTIRHLIVVANGEFYKWDGDNFVHHGLEAIKAKLETTGYPLMGAAMFGEIMFNHPLDLGMHKEATILIEDTVNYIVGMDGISRPWKYDGHTLTVLENAPRRGYCPVMHHEKLFCIDRARSSTLRWSGTFMPEEWNPFDFWDISKDDGDDITCIKKLSNDLIVFKRRSAHVLKGTQIADFAMMEINKYVGCVGQLAAWPYQMKMYFVADEGFCMTDGMQVINISRDLIPDTWNNLNHNFLHRAVVREWDGYIWIAVPKGTSQVNNYVLVFDPVNGAIFPLDGINIKNMTVFNDGVKINLCSIDDETGHVTVQDDTDNDYGLPIRAYWKGKYFDMKSPEVQKKSRRVYVENSTETQNPPKMSVCVDYKLNNYQEEDYCNLEYYRDNGMSREYIVNLIANRWNYISPKIEHETDGPCEVKGMTIYYKPRVNRNKNVGGGAE